VIGRHDTPENAIELIEIIFSSAARGTDRVSWRPA
jgi:hypothetical protein